MQTLTPNRSVTVTIDPPESIPVEGFFAYHRRGHEIREPELDNVEKLASGVWILKPEITSLANLHETTSGQLKAMRLSDYNCDPQITEIPMQRVRSDLPGVTAAPAVSATGDFFLTKSVGAGNSWDLGLTAAYPLPTLPVGPHYPLDEILQQKTGSDPPDQGYVLRWFHPAHPQEMIDWVMTFRFGGPITANGYGLFHLAFAGDGRAFLYEWINGAWVEVAHWHYSDPEKVPNNPHTVRIIPHAGRYIEFVSNVTEERRLWETLLLGRDRYSGAEISRRAHVYETRNRGNLPGAGPYAYPVTGAGAHAFRVRRDVSLRLQPSRITYPATGTLTDRPFSLPQVDFSSHVISVRRFSMVYYNQLTGAPRGATSAVLQNALTGLALAGGTESWTFSGGTYALVGYVLPGGVNAMQAQITLTNLDGAGGTYSPWFFGYEAFKVGENATPADISVRIGPEHFRQSPVTQLSITGATADPSQETASLRISDLVNRIPRLGVRGEGALRITTTYDDTDPSQTSVLLDGYWIKSEKRRRGALGRVYPSENWADYAIKALGKWKRLEEKDFLSYEIGNFMVSRDPAFGPVKGHPATAKITDAIRELLVLHAGMPESQVSVPDLAVRFAGNQLTNQLGVMVLPGTNVADLVIRLARDYLNMFLVWDANAGPSGMWRLKAVPSGTESALWTFLVSGPAAGRLATAPQSYPANSSFILRDSLTEYTVPPEGNWLRVTGVDEETKEVYPVIARNPLSYNRPGESTADPDHPDYLGRWRPLYRPHDATLIGKAAVKFVTRRIFNQACRAQRYARFRTPLPLFHAAASEPSIYTTHTHRPPLFGDVVWIGSASLGYAKYMVTHCTLDIRKEHHMIAELECVAFNEGT